MRKSILFALLITASFAYADYASAVTRPISSMTSGFLRKACNDNGGGFHSGSAHYGCYKRCGKGGKHSCGIECSTKTNQCTGTTPTRPVTQGIAGSRGGIVGSILTNGTGVHATGDETGAAGSAAPAGNILGSSSGMGASAPSATGNPVDKPKMPAAPPVPQIR